MSDTQTAPRHDSKSASKRPAATFRLPKIAPIWYSTIGLFVLSWILEPGSVERTAIDAMIPFAAILAVVAIGETLVVMTRGLDLSIAGTMTLTALVVSKYATDNGSIFLAIVVTLCVAIVIGIANGLMVTVLRITPLVATFAMSTVLAGVALTYSGGTPLRAPESLASFSLSKSLGVSNTVLVAFGFVVVVGFVVSKTVWGRSLQAVGASERAAYVSGVPSGLVKVTSYVGAAVCAGAAGMLLAGYVSTPNVTSGNRYLLSAIAAVVIGGTSLAGGKGRVVGTAVGALFLSQLSQLVLSLGLPTSAQLLIEAGVLAVAVASQSLRLDLGGEWWQKRRLAARPAPAMAELDEITEQ
jgi:ribose transport system permease protein